LGKQQGSTKKRTGEGIVWGGSFGKEKNGIPKGRTIATVDAKVSLKIPGGTSVGDESRGNPVTFKKTEHLPEDGGKTLRGT